MKKYLKTSKKHNYNLELLSEVEIFDLVLSKKISRFPKYFFEDVGAEKYCAQIVRHLMDDILNWDSELIKKNLRKDVFYDNGLGGMLNTLYNSSPYEAICIAYPERNYKPWDFVNAPNNYWRGKDGKLHGKQAMKWLIEERLEWTYDDIRKKLNHQVFIDNNLLGMIKIVYHSNLFEAVDALYPGVFQRWELGDHVVNEFWTKEEGIKAVKWLIQERLCWTDDDIRERLNKDVFIENGLYGMIQRCFNSSPSEAILTAYPGSFYEWELFRAPVNFWTFENACKAVKWLIEEKLKMSDEQIKKTFCRKLLRDNELVTIADKFNCFSLIDAIYPARFKPWEFDIISNDFWTEGMSVNATKWMLDKLGWDKEYAMIHLKKAHFKEYGISGAVGKRNLKYVRKLLELC